jgi:raffinose/stachyose/melibiose transport system substrate-binding protein
MDQRSAISRRRFLASGGKTLLAASFAGSLAAACTGDTGGGGGGEGSAGAKEFSLWLSNFDQTWTDWLTTNITGGFEQANQGYAIDVVIKPPESMGSLMRTALSAGQGPDAIPASSPSAAGQFVEQGWVLPLDAYSQQYGWDQKILGWALEVGKVQGKLYSVPIVWESFLILYNKKLFAENGWTVPTTGEELEAIAADAMGKGIVPFTAGNGEFRGATEWFVTNFFNHYSGPDALFQALTTEIPFTDPVFVEAVTMLNDWFQKGWFGGSVQKYFTNGFNDVYAALADGKAAMDLEGDWAIAAMSEFFGDRNDEWDWFPIPPLRDGVPFPLFELGIGDTFSINAKSEAADAVAKFLDWWFSQPQLAARKMSELAADPWPIPIPEADFPTDIDPRFRDQYLARIDATDAGNFGYTGYTFLGPKSYTYVFEEMEKVMTGEMTPAEYCQGLNDLFQQEYADGRVPPIIPRTTS